MYQKEEFDCTSSDSHFTDELSIEQCLDCVKGVVGKILKADTEVR